MKIALQDTKVFASYSRADKAEISAILSHLELDQKIDVFIDTKDILPAERWRDRLRRLILTSHAIIFFLSPNSVVSEECTWEIDQARAHNKKIVPVVVGPPNMSIPDNLADLNCIVPAAGEEAAGIAARIAEALQTNIDWVRLGTILLDRATAWEAANHPHRLLLKETELVEACKWSRATPLGSDPAAVVNRLITRSRRSADVRAVTFFYFWGLLIFALSSSVFLSVSSAYRETNAYQDWDGAINLFEIWERLRISLLLAQQLTNTAWLALGFCFTGIVCYRIMLRGRNYGRSRTFAFVFAMTFVVAAFEAWHYRAEIEAYLNSDGGVRAGATFIMLSFYRLLPVALTPAIFLALKIVFRDRLV